MALTAQQKAFFETFGFLVFPGLLAEDIPWINEGFDEIFPNKGNSMTAPGEPSEAPIRASGFAACSTIPKWWRSLRL